MSVFLVFLARIEQGIAAAPRSPPPDGAALVGVAHGASFFTIGHSRSGRRFRSREPQSALSELIEFHSIQSALSELIEFHSIQGHQVIKTR
jgi:hypothetical protein